MLETLRSKIQLVIKSAPQLRLILASEGSFGPHPSLPFINSNQEILMFYDRALDLEIVSSDITFETNNNEVVLHKNDDYQDFLKRCHFPSHAIILQTEKYLIKGITNLEFLKENIDKIFQAEKGVAVKLLTDMRANFNPTRMNFIGAVGVSLVEKIFTFCPACDSPGYSVVNYLPGLPCRECESATNGVLFKVYQCHKCGFKEQKKRGDNVSYSDPSECDICNP